MSKGKILVTGGCGYIGSHTIVDLIDSGYDVVSIDNFVNSTPAALKGIEKITGKKIENINADLRNTSYAIEQASRLGQFDGIIHFAALKSVEESVYHPVRYFQNNIGSTITTLKMMEELNIPHLIFSSSCTVYGSPEKLPVNEDTPINKAENPYGATKQACEILYEQYVNAQHKSHASGSPGSSASSVISLRYFNPAGAHTSALLGESSLNAPTNLVPVITETAIGLREELIVYGYDYPTRDGSCVRDYIHVMDLARAHTIALEQLLSQKEKQPYEVYNLGIGEGVTVLEAIHAFESATGVKLNYKTGPRRAGDVAAIYADNTRIEQQLKWKPAMDISAIMSSAWEWEKARRNALPS
ncbi:MAG TPA: UDP-glucose 4-epimerase GalE [Saprospiraceae bacterium]|nr:UDP-glucose 4-epimerase GalE [Saprospiraceae bacterium]